MTNLTKDKYDQPNYRFKRENHFFLDSLKINSIRACRVNLKVELLTKYIWFEKKNWFWLIYVGKYYLSTVPYAPSLKQSLG